MEPQAISFHDASLVDIDHENHSIHLFLEDIRVDDRPCNATVRLNGTGEIICDDAPIREFKMEYADGEILTFDINVRPVLLMVEWRNFEHHQQKTRCYRIPCETVEVDVGARSRPDKDRE